MRRKGEQHTAAANCRPGSVTWLDDSLPELKRLRALDQRYQLILISAVWMHLLPTQHARAMRIVSELLAPGGILIISLRNGPDDARRFHPVSVDELMALANDRALVNKVRHRQRELKRDEIEWDCLGFVLPDDGSGSLPLLRHIIVNDNKSASYKLGLLRALIRIAEGAPGMVIKRDDDWVDIPFGLVALYWLKIYMPLVLKHNLIQTPTADHDNERGYGWARNRHFYRLSSLSPCDFRVGAIFEADIALIVVGALRDICSNIALMPAKFITYPGQSKQVFRCTRSSLRTPKKSWQITKDSLSAFGVFSIPTGLWQTFSQHACWLEPAILNEWVRLMQSWRLHYNTSVYDRALQWNENRRDTTLVRGRIDELRATGVRVNCVWSQRKIRQGSYAVDHCFPWARWLNNDLWNLMPTTLALNNAKGDKLPSAALLEASRSTILDWWNEAYQNNESLSQRFTLEAEAALPLISQNSSIDDIFLAVQHQRAKLKASQQLAEWTYGMAMRADNGNL